MNTVIYDWKNKIIEEELENVIAVLKGGGIIVFPTDTVYGIACDANNDIAINKIYELKGRNNNKPICVLTSSIEKIKKVAYINNQEEQLINKYMPGALTIILNKKENVSDILTSNLKTIGVRIPNNEIDLKILDKLNYPLAVTSANISGEQSSIAIDDFINNLKNKVDIIIDGGITKLKVSSTIIKVEDEEIKILREGTLKI